MSELRFDPAAVRFKISPLDGLIGTVGGEWDKERRHPLESAAKHRAIIARYRDGVRWEETDLFRDTYQRRFKSGDSIRGCVTMQALLEQYYTRVDGMFAALKSQGFNASAGPLPTILIGRGEIFIGNQGNHRLAMAQVLGLPTIAGKVTCRHPLA